MAIHIDFKKHSRFRNEKKKYKELRDRITNLVAESELGRIDKRGVLYDVIEVLIEKGIIDGRVSRLQLHFELIKDYCADIDRER